MRINYRNFPAIQVVDKERCSKFLSDEYEHFFCAYNANNIMAKEDMGMFELQMAHEVISGFYTGLNLYYISPSFFGAFRKSAATLFKMLESGEECRKVHEDCAFIIEDMLWIVRTLPNGLVKLNRIHKEGALFTSFVFDLKDKGNIDIMHQTVDDAAVASCISIYYVLMLLKRYGQSEVEMIPRNKRVHSEVLKEKTINETGVDVKVLDSRWFKTICRDEGFLVSGHLRLQNYKNDEGQWDKKLIYIYPYTKNGYHRLAPVVNIEE